LEVLVQEGEERFLKVGASGHPLVVVALAVVVGAVTLSAREGAFDPFEEGEVVDVEFEGDLGLAAVAAEGRAGYEDAEEKALVKAGFRRSHECENNTWNLFHREVPRETCAA
jgi:hypothetical protein